MTTEPTVFIVDDDLALLDFISVLVGSLGLKTKTFPSADAFLRDFNPQIPGCLILDVQMPITGGFELQKALGELPLCPPIIFVTGNANAPIAVQAMREGAIDVLQKPFTKDALNEAIQRAISRDTANRERYARATALAERFAQLSPGEHDVLQLVLRGNTNKKIAATLDISERTVEDRRARILQKLKIDTVADLFRLAFEAGIPKGELSSN